jgi:carboxymethylenebutenolidase
MTVLAFEGTYSILYRDFGFPTGSGYTRGYIARPDQTGAFPLVVVLAGIDGITPSLKDLCRRLARHGFATVAPDLTRGTHPGKNAPDDELFASYAAIGDRRAMADIAQAIAFIFEDDAEWAVEGPVGMIGIDTGGRFAMTYAAHRGGVGALVVAYTPLAGDDDREHPVAETLPLITAPTVGLFGDSDDLIPSEGVDAAQQLNPHGQWILYEGVGHAFLDDDRESYHPGASSDALARILAMMRTHLPQPVIPSG